jgi:CheY-like chemotaxis protein
VPVAIRCRYCGARENINETTLKSLETGSAVIRSCSTCSAGTPWDVVAGEIPSSSFAGARAFHRDEDDTESVDETEAPVEKLATATAKARVLVVDDDEEVLAVVTKALAAAGVDVDTAESGRRALNRLVREDFDLILCDVRMPEFDGKQLFDFLGEHMPEQQEHVIFLTGDGGSESTAEFFRQTGVPHLAKPIDLPQLMRMVRERLGKGPEGEQRKGWAAKPAS